MGPVRTVHGVMAPPLHPLPLHTHTHTTHTHTGGKCMKMMCVLLIDVPEYDSSNMENASGASARGPTRSGEQPQQSQQSDQPGGGLKSRLRYEVATKTYFFHYSR